MTDDQINIALKLPGKYQKIISKILYFKVFLEVLND